MRVIRSFIGIAFLVAAAALSVSAPAAAFDPVPTMGTVVKDAPDALVIAAADEAVIPTCPATGVARLADYRAGFPEGRDDTADRWRYASPAYRLIDPHIAAG